MLAVLSNKVLHPMNGGVTLQNLQSEQNFVRSSNSMG